MKKRRKNRVEEKGSRRKVIKASSKKGNETKERTSDVGEVRENDETGRKWERTE